MAKQLETNAAQDMYYLTEYIISVFKSRSEDGETIPIDTMRHVLNLAEKAMAKSKGVTDEN